MKRLLAIMGVVSVSASASTPVVACTSSSEYKTTSKMSLVELNDYTQNLLSTFDNSDFTWNFYTGFTWVDWDSAKPDTYSAYSWSEVTQAMSGASSNGISLKFGDSDGTNFLKGSKFNLQDYGFKNTNQFIDQVIFADLHVYHYAIREDWANNPSQHDNDLLDYLKVKINYYTSQNAAFDSLSKTTKNYMKQLNKLS